MKNKNKFKKWLEKQKKERNHPRSLAALAFKAGISKPCIYNLFKKGFDVKGSTLVKLERAMKGQVTAKDLYEEFVE